MEMHAQELMSMAHTWKHKLVFEGSTLAHVIQRVCELQ